ncbi:MAG: hypothetical protein ABF289_20205 [Clostridiales bacterium]
MGRLALRKLVYSGDNYFFESPNFNNGLNIILGSNGNGKTTLMDLIYFALGGSVKQFKKQKNENRHKEICGDTNNIVKLFIEIDEKDYLLERSFDKNYISVTNIEINETEHYRVFRNKSNDLEEEYETDIFSDWILNELGIKVFEISQGTKKWKINFVDLMRLIYYDQRTSIERIFKDLDSNNSLIDSEAFRKAIFEILIGKNYNDYYDSLSNYNSKLREKYSKRDILKLFRSFSEDRGKDLVNSLHLNFELNKLTDDLKYLKIEREKQQSENKKPDKYMTEIEILKSKIINVEFKLDELNEMIKNKRTELDRINWLAKELDNEMRQIQKIKFTHSKLGLFSPDTCPYCLKKVDREVGKCICGKNVDESEYEQFFYNEKEYIDMIITKKKSLQSLKYTESFTKNILNDLYSEKESVVEQKKRLRWQINEISKNIECPYDISKIKAIDDNIVNVNEKINKLKQDIEFSIKKEKVDSELERIEKDLELLKIQTDEYENAAKKDIISKKDLFGEIYKEFLIKVDKHCTSARINDSYMPVINNGEYRESSASVHKRLMYFLTLLNISLEKKDTNYPNLLLIDTPDKEGIDTNNLRNSLKQIGMFFEYGDKFQIILTSGYDNYPSEYNKFVITRLYDDKLLLQKK